MIYSIHVFQHYFLIVAIWLCFTVEQWKTCYSCSWNQGVGEKVKERDQVSWGSQTPFLLEYWSLILVDLTDFWLFLFLWDMVTCLRVLWYAERQGIEGELKTCSDQFKAFERQDLKYQEDLKHLKQKLKKLEEKIAKVIARCWSSGFLNCGALSSWASSSLLRNLVFLLTKTFLWLCTAVCLSVSATVIYIFKITCKAPSWPQSLGCPFMALI